MAKVILWVIASGLFLQSFTSIVSCSRELSSVEDEKTYGPSPKTPSKPTDPTPPTKGYTSPPGGSGSGSTYGHAPSGGSGSGSSGHKGGAYGSTSPPGGSGSGYKTPPGGSGSGSTSPPGGSGSGYKSPPGGSGSGSKSPPEGDGSTYPPKDGSGSGSPGVPMPPSTWFPSPIPPFLTGTCDYWRSHPQAIWAICGYWNTIGRMLGFSPPAASPNLSLLDALKNTRTDGVGSLYREGTAAFLNSLANQRFVFSTAQVRNAFASALVSDQAAAAQARIFQRANEGRL